MIIFTGKGKAHREENPNQKKRGGEVYKFLKDFFFLKVSKVKTWIKLLGNFISISATQLSASLHTLTTSQENKENSHFHVLVRKMQILLACGGETRKRKCQKPSALAKSTLEAAEQLPSYPGNRVYPSADRENCLQLPPWSKAPVWTKHLFQFAAAPLMRSQ